MDTATGATILFVIGVGLIAIALVRDAIEARFVPGWHDRYR